MKRPCARFLRIAAIAAATLGAAAVPAAAQTTALFFDSQAGDPVGAGAKRTITPADAPTFGVNRNFRNGVSFFLLNNTSASFFFWSLDFSDTNNAPLAVGTYRAARQYSSTSLVGLNFSGSLSCATVTGLYKVLEVEYASDGEVLRFAADFEQHCNDATPALFGAIRFNSTIADLNPFGGLYPTYQLDIDSSASGNVSAGGLDCGNGGIVCTTGALPAAAVLNLTATPASGFFFAGWTGDCRGATATSVNVNGPKRCGARFEPLVAIAARTFVAIDSQNGDPIGQGRKEVYSPANSLITVTKNDSTGNGVTVTVNSINATRNSDWRFRFNARQGETLQAATYVGATRAGLTGLTPGLDMSENFSSCSTVTGRFTIAEIAFASDGTVSKLVADLEQHCDDGTPGLFVGIRYSTTAGDPAPFNGQFPLYRLTVTPPANGTIAGSGITCGSGGVDCQEDFVAATRVSLTPTPDTGFLFVGWTGDCHGSRLLSFNVNAPKQCSAVFEPIASAAPRTLVTFDSESGDTIGLGLKEAYSAVNSTITVAKTDSTGNGVAVTVTSVDEKSAFTWTIHLTARRGQPLQTGTGTTRYGGAIGQGFFFGAVVVPTVDIGTNGRTCSTATGLFVIRELVFALDGSIARFAADVEQHCTDAVPGLFVAVRFNSTITDPVAFSGQYPLYALSFASPANGTVTADGINCGTAGALCQVSFTSATQVTLVATPGPGFRLAGWGGDCHGATLQLPLLVNASKQCVADFQPILSAAPRTLVVWESQAGDTLGLGRSEAYSSTNSILTVTKSDFQGITVFIDSVEDKSAISRSIRIKAASDDVLQAGREYRGITRFASSTPQLEVTSGFSSCSSATGFFVVHDLALNGDGSVARLSVDVEYHCNDAAPGLFVAVRYNATTNDSTPFGGQFTNYTLTLAPPSGGTISGGALNCGPRASACQASFGSATRVTLTATPADGFLFVAWTGDCRGPATLSFHVNGPKQCSAEFQPIATSTPRTILYVDSRTGDFVGGGRTFVFATPSSTWSTSTSNSGNSVSFFITGVSESGSSSFWSLAFTEAAGKALASGATYQGVRAPFAGVLPGADISGESRGCNELTARFVVRDLAIANGSVTRFAADFEQHCENSDAGLFGAIRFNSSIDAIPFAGLYPSYRLVIAPPAHGRVTGAGLDCGSGHTFCQSDLGAPAVVTLTATPDPNYTFMGWTGPCHGATTTSIRVNRPIDCSAVFDTTVQTDARTLAVLNSAPGAIGGAAERKEVYSAQNGELRAARFGSSVEVTVNGWGDRRQSTWQFFLQAPTSETLHVGQYVIATTSSGPSAFITAESSGCSAVGQFTVRELVFDANDVLRLAIDFELRCNDASQPALTGSLKYNSIVDVVDLPPSTMSLDKTALRFAAGNTGAALTVKTSDQVVRLKQAGLRPVTWTATPNQPWITVSPTSGTGPAVFSIGVEFATGLPVSGSVTGAVVLAFTGAGNTAGPIDVTLTLTPDGASAAPTGVFDTPVDGITGVTGSIGVTGWALDDVEVTRVRIFRDPAPGEGASPIFIGNAVFVDGARPDVAALNPSLPRNTRAGWGYLLLTNFLPDGGNGTFRLLAFADDADGHTTLLGTRTITCTNATATLPFGAIDTPGQGEVITGTSYANFGWVLSRGDRRADPPGGGTVRVVIDGVFVGSPVGWTNRSDLTALFPLSEYSGIGSALGVFPFDPSTLSDGVHAIAWVVTDNQGGAEGVGSRFFTVVNGGAPLVSAVSTSAVVAETGPALLSASFAAAVNEAALDRTAVAARRGYGAHTPFSQYAPDAVGRVTIVGEELDRFEVRLARSDMPERFGVEASRYAGYMRIGDALGPLPAGSRLDPESGVFTWQAGAGFVHAYDLVFVVCEPDCVRREVRIVLNPKIGNRVGPQAVIDTPRAGAVVDSRFVVAGWAIDADSSFDTGVDTLHVWAYPLSDPEHPIFVGVAEYGGDRPDVSAIFGDRFETSGFGITVDNLPPGTYDLAVFPWSTVTGRFTPARVVRVTVR